MQAYTMPLPRVFSHYVRGPFHAHAGESVSPFFGHLSQIVKLGSPNLFMRLAASQGPVFKVRGAEPSAGEQAGSWSKEGHVLFKGMC